MEWLPKVRSAVIAYKISLISPSGPSNIVRNEVIGCAIVRPQQKTTVVDLISFEQSLSISEGFKSQEQIPNKLFDCIEDLRPLLS